MASTSTAADSSSESRGLFAATLFHTISQTKSTDNIVISPISIHTALAITLLGACDKTAQELQNSLRIKSADKEEIGKLFADLKEQTGSAQIIIANRMYLNNCFKLRSEFNELAKRHFNSEAETTDFSQATEAVAKINSWIEQNTNNKITNLLQSGSVDDQTTAIIVNAIYFKGEWQNPFSAVATKKAPFWTSASESIEVDTMFDEHKILYADLPKLNATAVDLPYKNSKISLMVILPNKRDGLGELREQLKTVAINELTSKFDKQYVYLYLPKFRIEFTLKLNDALRSMGIRKLFEDDADLSGILESGPPLKVSDVQHKAFIVVDEAGSEAAAATFMKAIPMSLNLNTKEFKADHPFVFAIKSAETVYFVGQLTSF